jgi:hypothetical protein
MNSNKLSSIEGTIAMVCLGIALATAYVQADAGVGEPAGSPDQSNLSKQQLWNFAMENGDGLGAGDPYQARTLRLVQGDTR